MKNKANSTSETPKMIYIIHVRKFKSNLTKAETFGTLCLVF